MDESFLFSGFDYDKQFPRKEFPAAAITDFAIDFFDTDILVTVRVSAVAIVCSNQPAVA